MPTPVVISGQTYQYPAPRDVAGWGGAASDAFIALSTVVNSLSGPYDILNTPSNISNNQSSAANVVGLAFDTAHVKGARVDYNIYRVTSTSEVVEQGTIYLAYKPNAAQWDMVFIGAQAANVVLSITPAGQVQYTSNNMSGINYSGTITFRAVANYS